MLWWISWKIRDSGIYFRFLTRKNSQEPDSLQVAIYDTLSLLGFLGTSTEIMSWWPVLVFPIDYNVQGDLACFM